MVDFAEQYEIQTIDIDSGNEFKPRVRGAQETVLVGTKHDRDRIDLARWGKEERLKRMFSSLSTVSLTACVTMSWVVILGTFVAALTNGGTAGLVYSYLCNWTGYILQTLVFAELASMIPLAGGQYHWVAILAPPKYSRFLSYTTGWLTLLCWHAGISTTAYVTGIMLLGVGFLLLVAIIALSLLVNTVLIRFLPHVETAIFLLYILGFFAIIIPLLYFTPQKASARHVFTTFYNGGNWSTMALSWFVGLSPSAVAFGGVDAASHIAEEVRNASSTLPKSMISAQLINGSLGFAMALAVLFCLQDLESVLATPTGFPYIQVLFDSTKSVSGTTVMASVVVACNVCLAIGSLATASRMVWAMARENALPLSGSLSRLRPGTSAPLNAVFASALLSSIFGLVALGSDVAFYALTSLIVAGGNGAYAISAVMLLIKRLNGEELKYGPFSLGRFGVPVIIFSLIYSTIATFFSFWPPTVQPTLQLMNWSVVVTVGFITIFIVFWYIHGKRHYKGPIVEVVLRDTRE